MRFLIWVQAAIFALATTTPSFGIDESGANLNFGFLPQFDVVTFSEHPQTQRAKRNQASNAGTPLSLIDTLLEDTFSNLRLPDLRPSMILGLDPVQTSQNAFQQELLNLPPDSLHPKARIGIASQFGQGELFTGWSLTDPKETQLEDRAPEVTLRLRF